MKKFFKEKIGLIIFLIIVIGVVGIGFLSINKAKQNAITYKTDYEAPESNLLEGEGEYVSIAKSEKTELFFNEVKGTVQVKNLENGYVWKTAVTSEDYEMKGLSKKWKAYLQSSITITYNDLKKRDASPTKLYSALDAKWMSSELIPNGVSVTYGFTKPGIFVTVEYTLEGDELVVRVPHEKIEEFSRYAITTMEILPFFGACTNDEDGYVFYPDGSGAITSFANASERPENVLLSSYYTYSNRYLSYANYYNEDNYDRYVASMPVYGIKRGSNALFAAVTGGEAATGVLVYPSGCNNIKLNHVGFQVDTRNVFNVDMYNMSTGTDSKANGGIIQRVDKNFIPEARECRYFFLSGDQASYSGMANVYRDYLKESGKLQDVVSEGDKMPLALTLLCGASKEGMIFSEYVPMTTTDQAAEIINGLNAKGIDSLNVVLRAWQSDANEYNNSWPISSKIGGKSGIKDLSELVEKNPGVNVFLAQDTTFVYDKTKGLDETNDILYNGLGLEVSSEFFDGTHGYLLNAQAVQNLNDKLLSNLKNAKKIGVAYDSIGRYIYADSNENYPFTKQAMTEKIKEILKSTSDDGRKVAVSGSNQYVLSDSDYIYELKEDAYGLMITDYAVPFVEMVLSGNVFYSTAGAGNLSYDLQYQKLKWIEFGATPYFYLTYESGLNLRKTNYATVFSSTYADWEDELVGIYNEFSDNFSDVYSKSMVSHEYLTDKLVRVEYENGVAIYINYSEKPASYKGVNVDAKSYTVVRGGK